MNSLTLPKQDCARCGEPLRIGQEVDRDRYGTFPSLSGRGWRHAGGPDACIKATFAERPGVKRRVALVLALAALREIGEDEQRIASFLDTCFEEEIESDPPEFSPAEVDEPEAIAAARPADEEAPPWDRPVVEGVHEDEECGHAWASHTDVGCLAPPSDPNAPPEVRYCPCTTPVGSANAEIGEAGV
jgi:hypothetical protein